MQASLILLVVVRLQCVVLVLHGFRMLTGAMADTVGYPLIPGGSAFAMPLTALVLAVTLWFLAPFVVKAILDERDGPVSLQGLRLEDLYSFGFLLVGLYFVIGSMAPALNWAHYTFAVAATSAAANPEERRSLYQLLDPAITLAAGLACVLNGREWAVKLVRRRQRTEPVAAPNGGPAGSVDNSNAPGGPPSVS
jgi:hypothetical protein